jgi:hypothetical protein
LVFLAQLREHFRGSRAIVDIGGCNQDDQQQTHGVHDEMALSAVTERPKLGHL